MMTTNSMSEAQGTNPRQQPRTANSGAQSLDVERSLREHWKLAIGVAAVVLLAILAWALVHPSTYSTESLVYIQPTSPKVLSDGTDAAYDPSQYESYVQQQIETVTRYDILQAALARLGTGVWRKQGESEQSAIARLQAGLKVERVANSYQMSISLKGSDPETITETVNAVTDAYLLKARKDELAQADDRLVVLTQERDRIEAQLATDRQEQAALGKSLGVASTAGDSGNPYDAQLVSLRDELVKAREAHDFAQVQLASVSKPGAQDSQALNAMADEMIASDPGLSSMKASINQRLSLLSSQMAGLTPAHPLYKLDQEEIVRLNQSLESMTAQLRRNAAEHLQQKLSVDLARSAGVESQLNAQLAQQVAAATKGGPKLQRADELTADIARQQARFASVDDMVRSLTLESSATGVAHISMPAMRPFAPDASKKRLVLLMALPLAFLFGAGAAVLARKLDPRVYIAKDVEEILLFPPMAVIPSSEDVTSATVEEYTLRLAAAIDHALRLGSARTFALTAITSSTAIEELVGRLARKMEDLGHRTVVMSGAGAIQRHAAGDLPAGTLWNETMVSRSSQSRESRAGEGVRTSAVIENIRRLKQENDLLLISASPLMASGESEYLARFADATILVAESAQTTRKELTEAGALLERLNVAGAGVVLCNLRMRNADPLFKQSVRAFEERPRTEPARMQQFPAESVYTGPDRRRSLQNGDGHDRRAGRASDRRSATDARIDHQHQDVAAARSGEVDEEVHAPEAEVMTDFYSGPDRRIYLPYHVYIGIERRSASAPEFRYADHGQPSEIVEPAGAILDEKPLAEETVSTFDEAAPSIHREVPSTPVPIQFEQVPAVATVAMEDVPLAHAAVVEETVAVAEPPSMPQSDSIASIVTTMEADEVPVPVAEGWVDPAQVAEFAHVPSHEQSAPLAAPVGETELVAAHALHDPVAAEPIPVEEFYLAELSQHMEPASSEWIEPTVAPRRAAAVIAEPTAIEESPEVEAPAIFAPAAALPEVAAQTPRHVPFWESAGPPRRSDFPFRDPAVPFHDAAQRSKEHALRSADSSASHPRQAGITQSSSGSFPIAGHAPSSRPVSEYSAFIAETFDALAAAYSAGEDSGEWADMVSQPNQNNGAPMAQNPADAPAAPPAQAVRAREGAPAFIAPPAAMRQGFSTVDASRTEQRTSFGTYANRIDNLERTPAAANQTNGSARPEPAQPRIVVENIVRHQSAEAASASAQHKDPSPDPEILPPAEIRRSGWLRMIDRDSRVMRAFTGEEDGEDMPTLPSRPGQYGRSRR